MNLEPPLPEAEEDALRQDREEEERRLTGEGSVYVCTLRCRNLEHSGTQLAREGGGGRRRS